MDYFLSITGFFCCLGGIYLLFGIQELWIAYRSTFWSQTDAVILSSHVLMRESMYPVANITYRYQVNGRDLTGETIFVGQERFYCNTLVNHLAYYVWGPGSFLNFANQLAEKYATGKRVAVYYQPTAPYHAVLQCGLTRGSWTKTLVGVVVTLSSTGIGPLFWILG